MKSFAATASLSAIILFIMANLCLGVFIPVGQSALMAHQPKDLSWWTVDSFINLNRKPDVVLIGSSVMTKISNEGDATFLGKVLDARTHQRSQYLEYLLDKNLPTPLYCASLSIPGMNASDVSIVSSVLFDSAKKPELVIYGIAPRDLMDNGLSMPSQTSTFHLMEKIGNLTSVGGDARIGNEAKFKYAMNSAIKTLFPLYRYQDEIALDWRHFCQRQLSSIEKAPESAESTATESGETDNHKNEIDKMLLALHVVQDEYNKPIYSLPHNPEKPETADLKNCYLVSYNPFRKQLYETQLRFLSRFLDNCQSHGIKVLLVNMPLRHDSFDLMPAGLYQRYMTDVTALAAAKEATFLDFQKDVTFSPEDFVDQVHLTGAGGCKFVKYLAEAMEQRQLVPHRAEVTVAAGKSAVTE